jgi:hypothetical protein
MTKSDNRGPHEERDRLLALLLHESTQARDDDRYMSTQFATIISVAVALIVAMATLFSKTCAAGDKGCPCPADYVQCNPETGLTPIPSWIYGVAPMLPAALVAYGILLSMTMTLRSYYMRIMERKIHKLTGQLNAELPVPSWSHLQLEVTGQARSGFFSRLNWLVMYTIIGAIMLTSIYLAVTKIPGYRHQVFALAIDAGLIIVPLLAVVLNATRGSRFWQQALKGLPGRLETSCEIGQARRCVRVSAQSRSASG